jgi:hypothetical protein
MVFAMSCHGTPQSLEFPDLLPLLVSVYQRGELVPFIGAGMSVPKHSLWQQFVQQLEGSPDASGQPLEVRAQRAVTRIRNTEGYQCFLKAIDAALKGSAPNSDTPPQTEALAAIYWPLTISTNYDDLFYSACRQHSAGKVQAELLGRSPEDCKRIVSSLKSPFDRELIWHIQGFLGDLDDDKFAGIDKACLAKLRHELVVGHAEYRSVTNTEVQFRRCFSEVFKSRSFLFLGSGLTENYFLNLFGEILELCGPSTVPHFAFAERGKLDTHFLAEQMNILVCEYTDPKEVGDRLIELRQAIRHPAQSASGWTFDAHTSQDLRIVPGVRHLQPERSEVEAWVVHRGENGSVDASPYRASQPDIEAHFAGLTFEPGRYVLPSQNGRCYAVTASLGEGEAESVDRATTELLNEVTAAGHSSLHCHLPSSGGSVPPVYGFIEAVRTFGAWKGNRDAPKLVLHVGWQVILNLTSQQIDVAELLTAKRTRFWVLVYDEIKSEPLRRVLYYPTSETKLQTVLDDVGVPAHKEWLVSLCPSPRHNHVVPTEHRTTEHLAQKTLQQIGVVFGSVVTLERAGSSACGAAAG